MTLWTPLYLCCRAVAWVGDRLFGASNVMCAFGLWLAVTVIRCSIVAWSFPETSPFDWFQVMMQVIYGVLLRNLVAQRPALLGPGEAFAPLRTFYGGLFLVITTLALVSAALGNYLVLPSALGAISLGLVIMDDEHDGERSLVRRARRLIDRALSRPQMAVERTR